MLSTKERRKIMEFPFTFLCVGVRQAVLIEPSGSIDQLIKLIEPLFKIEPKVAQLISTGFLCNFSTKQGQNTKNC